MIEPTSLRDPWGLYLEAFMARLEDRIGSRDKPRDSEGVGAVAIIDPPEDPPPGTVFYRVAHGERPPPVPMPRLYR